MQEESEHSQKLRKSVMEQLKRQQIEAQKREVAKRVLDPSAYERLANIRTTNPQLYMQLLDLIVSVVQQNKVMGKISEEQFVELLKKLTFRPETKLEFKHK